MTHTCNTCPTPNACEIGNLCAYRDMQVIERAMARVDAMQRPAHDDKPAAWIGWVIGLAFAVWLVAMFAKTGA